MRVAFLFVGGGLACRAFALRSPVRFNSRLTLVWLRCSAATTLHTRRGSQHALTGRASKLGDCQSAHASLDLLLPPPPPLATAGCCCCTRDARCRKSYRSLSPSPVSLYRSVSFRISAKCDTLVTRSYAMVALHRA
uniref:Putative secreted protein n=1 Tax=Anopheles triannulatus TaxID=58253 RepID=A0A2M4B4T0_9DIPT